MPLSQLADENVQLSLLATTGPVGLAAALLTERFGLSPGYAQSVLEQGYGLLIARLGLSEARAAMPLLAALGLRVAVQPCLALPPDEVCDVSIRIAKAKHATRAILALERLMGLTGLSATAFCGLEGHVVGGLSVARAEWLAAALRHLSGVSAALSEHRTARYDLFAEAELTETESSAVRRHLRLLGSAVGGFSDAIGSGLDRRVVERLLVRFPDLGLFAANQAFQRHELLLIGKGSLSRQEFVDFLVSRPIAQSIPARLLLTSLPLRVESLLTRPAAKQFLADYQGIGMQAITRLVRRTDGRAESL